MFFPFLDYQVRTFSISNGSAQTYTLPYKAMVCVGNYRPDEENNISVNVLSNNVIDNDSDGISLSLLVGNDIGGGRSGGTPGFYVGETGDVIRVDSSDDAYIEINIFRLPESV